MPSAPMKRPGGCLARSWISLIQHFWRLGRIGWSCGGIKLMPSRFAQRCNVPTWHIEVVPIAMCHMSLLRHDNCFTVWRLELSHILSQVTQRKLFQYKYFPSPQITSLRQPVHQARFLLLTSCFLYIRMPARPLPVSSTEKVICCTWKKFAGNSDFSMQRRKVRDWTGQRILEMKGT